MNLAEQYIEKQISSLKKIKDIPDFRPGDVVKVHNKIIDESNERIQTELSLLLFLSQIKNQKFFNLELFSSFSLLSHSLRGSSSHFLSDSRQELDFFNPFVFFFLEFMYLKFMCSNILIKLFFLGLHRLVFKTFLNELTDKNLLLIEKMLGLNDQYFRFFLFLFNIFLSSSQLVLVLFKIALDNIVLMGSFLPCSRCTVNVLVHDIDILLKTLFLFRCHLNFFFEQDLLVKDFVV